MLAGLFGFSSCLAILCLLSSLTIQALASKDDVTCFEAYPPVQQLVNSMAVLANALQEHTPCTYNFLSSSFSKNRSLE